MRNLLWISLHRELHRQEQFSCAQDANSMLKHEVQKIFQIFGHKEPKVALCFVKHLDIKEILIS